MQHKVNQLAIIFLFICGWATPTVAQTFTLDNVPNPKQSPGSRYVSNPDQLLSPAAVSRIDALLGKLEDSTTAQVAVVCLNSIGENVPKDVATALFRKWGLGYRQKNNGLLILLVKDQHRIEMETGYGLEGVLPDAICKRIQLQHMIPLAKAGDVDGAMLAGVQEISRLLTEPVAREEVYDESKYTYRASEPLTNSAIFVLFLLLIPCLFVLRLFAFFKKSNPVTDQIEKAIAKTKWRWAWVFLVYILMPVFIGLMFIQLRHPLSLHGWHSLTVLYAYTGVVLWDARRRRKKAFANLFGAMTEPARYVHQKAARFNGWGHVLLMPVPFLWLKKRDEETLDALRNHSRQSPEGYVLTRVAESEKATYLTDYQKVEQQLGSVDYDVWRNETHGTTEAIGYETMTDTVHQYCPACGSKAMSLATSRIVTEATTDREGRGINDFECKACGHHREVAYLIALVRQTAPARSSSSGSSPSSTSSWRNGWGEPSSGSSSSSSSSSWGGGSSGGGGAGSSW